MLSDLLGAGCALYLMGPLPVWSWAINVAVVAQWFKERINYNAEELNRNLDYDESVNLMSVSRLTPRKKIEKKYKIYWYKKYLQEKSNQIK